MSEPMTLEDELDETYVGFVIPDFATVHYHPLRRAIADVLKACSEIRRLREDFKRIDRECLPDCPCGPIAWKNIRAAGGGR